MRKMLLGVVLLALAACTTPGAMTRSPTELVASMSCDSGPSPQDILARDLVLAPADTGIYVNVVLTGKEAASLVVAMKARLELVDTVVILSSHKYTGKDGMSHVIMAKDGCVSYENMFPNTRLMPLLPNVKF